MYTVSNVTKTVKKSLCKSHKHQQCILHKLFDGFYTLITKKGDMESEKRSLMKNTVKVSLLYLISRIFGLFRDVLQAWFLGIGAQSDAFLIAFRIPNLFRQIFAEGALSSALVPYLTRMKHEGRADDVKGLLSLVMLIVGCVVLMLCVAIMLFPDRVIHMFAPGFSPEQNEYATKYILIMFPFIFLVFICAVLTAGLHSVNHFFTPALAPVLFNITLITFVVSAIKFKLPVEWICLGVLVSGFSKLFPRVIAFWHKGLSLGAVTLQSWKDLKAVSQRFFPCLAGVGIHQINVLLDTVVASFLPCGQVTMLHYAYRFMHAPLAVLGIATSITFLPYFSKIAIKKHGHLKFALVEVSKLLFFVATPITLFLCFHSKLLFKVLFSHKADVNQIYMAGNMLTILALSIFILSINRVIIKLFYALQDTKTPTWIISITTAMKIAGNIFSVAVYGGVYGIVLSTVIFDAVATPAYLSALATKHDIKFDFSYFRQFLWKYFLQLLSIATGFLFAYIFVFNILTRLLLRGTKIFYITHLLMAVGLLAISMLALLLTRKKYGLDLYFIEK
ncbi:murein biosynthesis integral membrane protein MurJ [Candidatus Dependentiae bacterium]